MASKALWLPRGPWFTPVSKTALICGIFIQRGIDGDWLQRYSLPIHRHLVACANTEFLGKVPDQLRSVCSQPVSRRKSTHFIGAIIQSTDAFAYSGEANGGTLKADLEITPNLEPLFGTRDENLRLMEDSLGVRIDLRSDSVHVEGPDDAVSRVQRVFQDFESLRRQGINLHNGELNGMLRLVVADPAISLRSLADAGKARSNGIKRTVQPRSLNQRKYIEAIEQNDMVFGVGPAGTGKTYLAVAMAVAAMNAKKLSRIVLVRPAVEAGERLGFLPGTLQEKVDPYLRPLYDALYDLLDPEKVDKMLEKNIIEVAPLAFMRGRTLNDAFIIMDEAQNTTIEQMKMFLTRMGNNSKAVITGDITQIDLPNPRKSGLLDAINILDGVEGISFCHFADGDVVRHALVQRIVRAYDAAKPQQQELPLNIGETMERPPAAEQQGAQQQSTAHQNKPQ